MGFWRSSSELPISSVDGAAATDFSFVTSFCKMVAIQYWKKEKTKVVQWCLSTRNRYTTAYIKHSQSFSETNSFSSCPKISCPVEHMIIQYHYFYCKTNKMHQCIKFILFWNDILHVSDGLSIHHQEFKTVHTATGICQTDTANAC